MSAADARGRAEAAAYLPGFAAALQKSLLDALASAPPPDASRHSVTAVRRIKAILASDDQEEALREIDRAWRSLPKDAELLAPIYARLLAFDERNSDATLRILLRITAPDPDVAALIIRSLIHLRRADDSRQHLDSALARFCVSPDSLLSHVATEVLRHEDTDAPGWIGLNPILEFVGELHDEEVAHALELQINGGPAFSQPIRPALQPGHRHFSFKLPQLSPGDTLRAILHDEPLLGSGLSIPREFGLDGRAHGVGRKISGWTRLAWLPTRPIDLAVRDETGQERIVTPGPIPRSGQHWALNIDLQRLGLRGDRIDIAGVMPDGRRVAFPDSPVLFDKAVKLPGKQPPPLVTWRPGGAKSSAKGLAKHPPPVDVIIPVYLGHEETLACIKSALATVGDARVIVVDDATPDAELAVALDELEAAGQITLLRNAHNAGFVVSVNRALAHNRTHDAVLLNSDAVVFGDWLRRLRAAAYRTPQVGTVTPFSNSGTIATYPGDSKHPLGVDEAKALHTLASTVNADRSLAIPVGVGFCMYVRRDCLRDVGDFDATLFGKGYGEETDFCLRAAQRGWSHQLAADIFVFHAGGLSFGTRRAALLERSQRLINTRHVGYEQMIADFIAKDAVNPARRRLDEERLLACEGRFVLLVSLALSGGVQRFVTERCREIREQGMLPLILRPFKPGDSRRCELWTDALDAPNLQYTVSSDLGVLDALLRKMRISEIEIQHFLHIDARVIDLIRALDVPYDVTVHDYSWICPRVTLMNGSGRYCGEPAVTVCNNCVKRNGSHLGGKPLTVQALRQRSTEWLQEARTVIVPSSDTATRLKKYFPIEFEVQAHTDTAISVETPLQPALRDPESPLRVAVIGAIGEHKGYRILLNCARDAKLRRLPLEFIVIGYTEDDGPLLDTKKVFITGRYSEGEASHLVRREKPHIAFLPSVWPETWCYALDEALAAGLPVVAFDLGAVAERLRDKQIGTVLPLDMDPKHINDSLLNHASAATAREPHATSEAVRDLEPKRMSSATSMAKRANEEDSSQTDALSASVQVLPLPPGLYLFSVKAATASAVTQGKLQLPAMHVGLGPGVRSEQVEFVAGPSTEGAWLFAQEDLLVTKVNGAGATLILTSVRAPGGEVLSIKVERLEGRADAVPPVTTMAALPPSKPMAAAASKKPQPVPVESSSSGALPLKIGAHIRARGDMSFSDVPWAGRVGPGLWIESFSIKPLERFKSQDIEYKGLTGSGFETPWLSDEKMCGTKGMSVPLVGYAVRLRPSPQAAMFDCEYSGYFKSGAVVGPLRNGAPCRSTVANDPLEGIQVRICKRQSAGKPAANAAKGAKAQETRLPQAAAGPSFGRYREPQPQAKPLNGNGTKGTGKAAVPARSLTNGSAPGKQVGSGNRKSNGASTPTQRSAGRRS